MTLSSIVDHAYHALAIDERRKPFLPAVWDVDTPLQDVLAARPLTEAVGYLRIWSFDVADDEAFVGEMARLLGLPARQAAHVFLLGHAKALASAGVRAGTEGWTQRTRALCSASPTETRSSGLIVIPGKVWGLIAMALLFAASSV